MHATTHHQTESRYAAWRLAVAVAIMTLGASGMYVVPVALPAVQAEFNIARGDASLPYSLLMIGFGLGLLATAAFAMGALENGQPPFFMPWQIPVAAFAVIQVICMLAALMGIVRLSLYEPAMVFRA